MLSEERFNMAVDHIQRALECLGHAPANKEATVETPKRIAKFWQSVVPQPKLSFDMTTFDAQAMDELVIERGIRYSSLCEHHFLPFFGEVHLCYLPGEEIVGLSKLPRLVDFCANRPQTQEYLTMEIGRWLEVSIKPRFVGVVLTGIHTCVGCRGVRKQGCETVTSYFSPKTPEYETTKREFLTLMKI